MLKRYSKIAQEKICFAHEFEDEDNILQLSIIRGQNEYGISQKSEMWDKYISEWGPTNPRRLRAESKAPPTDFIKLINNVFERPSADLSEEPEDKNLLVQNTFHALAKRWNQETEFTSSAHDLVLHPAYQRIIGLGPDVIPFVLEELRDNGGHWFWALQALTGENPVPEADIGRYKKMRDAWVGWGTKNSYI